MEEPPRHAAARGHRHTGLLFEITDPPVQTELLLVQTDEDQPVSVDVRSVVTPVLEGSVVISFSRISGPSYGVLSPVEPGWWTYTPIPDFHGADEFTYEACDLDGFCGEGQVVIWVLPVNDPPVAAPVHVTVTEDTATTITLEGSDVEGDLLHFQVVSAPQHGYFTQESGSPEVVYTPFPDYVGPDGFLYQVCDGVACTIGDVTITVVEANDAPTMADASVHTGAREPVEIDLTALVTDPDEGDTHTFSVTGQPENGRADLRAGTLTYTPGDWFAGTDTIEVRVTDSEGATGTATISVTVTPGEPFVKTATIQTGKGGSHTYRLLEGMTADSPVLLAAPGFTFTTAASPAHGRLAYGSDSVTYTSDPDYVGDDAFSVLVCSDHQVCELHQVTVHADLLPFTGGDHLRLAIGALALVVAGAGLLAATRRRTA